MACDPFERLMLMMAGKSCGVRRRQRQREKQRVKRWLVQQNVDGENRKHQQQGHFAEQVAEPADTAFKLRHRRAQGQPLRNLAECSSRAGLDDEHAGGSAARIGAMKTQFVRSARPAAAPTTPGCFSTGNVSPVRTA